MITKIEGLPVTKIQFPQSRKYRTVAIPAKVMKALKIKEPEYAVWSVETLGEGLDKEDIVIFFTVDSPEQAEDKLKRIEALING